MERRHLTVLFCDLADSTALSARLEPEPLADIIVTYRQLMQAEVANAGGTVARYLGDGMLVYFGYPAADDEDPMRAVRAALGMLRALPRLNASMHHLLPAPLTIRIGVHTGLVLIEHGGGELHLMNAGAIGKAPNIAARLQELAQPGTALVSDTTYALTASRFDYRACGEASLKGITEKVAVYRPVQERVLPRRHGPARPGAELVGREREAQRLRALWDATRQGAGATVLVTGDAGIGKSHLANWMASHAEAERGVVLTFLCQFDTTQSPFRAVIDGLQRHLLLGSATPEEKVQRLRRVLRRGAGDLPQLLPLLCELLSLPPPADLLSVVLTPEGRRQLLFELLAQLLERIAAGRPLLVVVENAHWSDPSSQEWLTKLVRRTNRRRMLLLVTSRPEPLPHWHADSGVTRLDLERLSQTELTRILDQLDAGQRLDAEARRAVLERSDGVPLFLEELCRTVAEGGVITSGLEKADDIPARLHAMLAARLDRLGAAKAVAQAAAVIGRQFALPLLRALSPAAARELEPGLAALIQSDIVRLDEGPEGSVYRFKHALLRDAAYDSLLTKERRTYHAKLARTYPKLAPAVAEEQPEIVAHHASLGGLFTNAVALWNQAGSRAFERSAYREAESHFRRGLADAEQLSGPSTTKLLARFHASLAATTIATNGFAAPEVERLSVRAYELSASVTNQPDLESAIGGLNTYYQVRGPLHRARELSEQLVARARARRDEPSLIRTLRRLGWCLFCMGDIAEGRRILADALERYNARHRTERLHGREIDAGVLGYANLGWVESFSGDAEQALAYCNAGRELAVAIGERPMDMAYALCMSAATNQVLGHPASALAYAEHAHDLAQRNALPYWRAWALVLLGWARCDTDPAEGIRMMLRGLSAYKATGARLFVPYNLGLIAEAALMLERYQLGLRFTARAQAVSTAIDAHFSDSSLLITRARLLHGIGHTVEAEAALSEALRLARSQGARTMVRSAEDWRLAIPSSARRAGEGRAARVRRSPHPA